MDELIADFISETSESLLDLDNELVELENNPDNDELLGKIFRVMHTIKGTCGFLELNKLASIGHAGENILDKMRSKEIPVNSENISVLLETIDAIKDMVDYIQDNDGKEPETDYSPLIDKINATLATGVSGTPKKAEKDKPIKKQVGKDKAAKDPAASKTKELTEAELDNLFEDKSKQEQTNKDKTAEDSAPSKTKELTEAELDNLFEDKSKQEQTNKDKPAEEKIKPVAKKTAPAGHSEADNANQAIRVKVEVLDDLMQAVSELVLNRNQLLQLNRLIHDDKLSSSLQSLNFITSSIQEIAMGTRMQPINNAWIKLPRLIREMSKDLNKKINLVMIGKETDLDKQLIEAIKDPLMHMIRNSADHGLEDEETRLAAGKPAEGTITLQAYHSSGNIIIEISDDGAGIDVQKVKNKILENKLASESDLNLLTEQQIIQYIFKAGLSTSEKITSVSGRGVGMDVVKNNIENIRGSIEIKSVTGKGSTFILKIPLTLAIMSVLVVDSVNQKFGIPQSSILEMIRVGEDSPYDIEEINNHMILRLRENLLPLVKLSEILQLPKNNDEDDGEDYYIVICDVRGKNFGLIVDNIYDTEEIVLKPLSKALKSINVYSGNTLLGNGEIINILSPDGVAQNIAPFSAESDAIIKQEAKKTSILSSFLVLKYSNSYKAIPLELVSRLESIDVTKIETMGDKKVIQYMGSLMYLEFLDPDYVIPKTGKQQVVVFIENDHILGLVVEKIIDIVTQNMEDNLSFDQSNLTALVINDKTMDIVDINSYFEKLFFSHTINESSDNFKYKILLVEDSPYFRKLLSALLKIEDFDVSSVNNATEALKLIEEKEDSFSLLITDLNMQTIDGVELAELCKENPKSQDIPIIGLTSPTEPQKKDSEDIDSIITNFVSKTNNSELIKLTYSLLNPSKEAK